MRRWLGLVLLLSGCLAHERRGMPLYPRQGALLPLASVAKLSGPVIHVDERAVDGRAGTFELLPGCHIVMVGGRTGNFDQLYGGYTASLPELVYAFRMRAGHAYSVELEPVRGLGTMSTAHAELVAYDKDARGVVAIVPRAVSPEAIAACRRWLPER